MDLIISVFLVYYLPLFVLCFFSIKFFISITRKPSASSKLRRPPSPPALPVLGHLHLLRSGLSKSLHSLATNYGPLIRIQMVSETSVVVSNSAVAKEMLKDNEMNFVSRPDVSGSSDYNIYKGSSFVFAEYGDYWRFLKKLCMTELLSVSQIARFADIRREEKMKLLENLFRCSEEGKICDLGKELVGLTNNNICRMAMSTRCSGSDNESDKVWNFVKGVEALTLKFSLGELLGPYLSKLDLFGYGRKMKELLLEFDEFVEKVIVQHELDLKSGNKKGKKKDDMDILLEICRDENAEIKFTRRQIKSFLLELFMAGTDTTSVVLQWAMAELINHQTIFNKLKEEINGVVGSKRLVEESDIPNLPYLQAVVKETLRLHPSAPLIFRRCDKDCKINGYDLLANERIIINLNAIMRDPKCWENPLKFMPERFTEKHKQFDQYHMDLKGQNFSLFPFGSGRRGCPGASFALSVIHVMVATLVQCFDFKVEGEEKLNMEEGTGFSGAMVHPLLCFVTNVAQFNPLKSFSPRS
ncbi:OLC1v1000622C1 [Oldenlandia corymbosa var. corymbosa]|uniref:OLC1v1000622C1 n=1 Tax=Oldenlandia corymbosa var. corymbosa TaxID=529605 RepID=A0AAV1D6B7_OLDCO|nr:OLC1v1000622C1 [Oldenlandia corymbosa var. corymbosa]